jgi:hypothetical protein
MKQGILQAEWCLKALLRIFGGTCVLAVFAFVMPQSWMAAVHQWLRMGVLPDQPVVDYLARATSAWSAFYGGLLFILALDVYRYARVIRYQAIMLILFSGAGAILGWRAGMPAWWIISDVASCWICGGAMLWLQKRLALSRPES